MKKLLVVFGITAMIIACNSAGDGADQASPATEDNTSTQPAAPAENYDKGLELIGASDCTTCHQIDKKNIGPAYTEVAAKYEKTDAVVDTLINKIIHGGQGNWGTVPMTPHADLSREDAREMVNYILSLKK